MWPLPSQLEPKGGYLAEYNGARENFHGDTPVGVHPCMERVQNSRRWGLEPILAVFGLSDALAFEVELHSQSFHYHLPKEITGSFVELQL